MKKWGGQLDIRPPNLKIGGDVSPPSPPGLTPLFRAVFSLLYFHIKTSSTDRHLPELEPEWRENGAWDHDSWRERGHGTRNLCPRFLSRVYPRE